MIYEYEWEFRSGNTILFVIVCIGRGICFTA